MPGRQMLSSAVRRSSVKIRGSRAHRRIWLVPSLEVDRGHRTTYVPLKHDSEKIDEGWERTGRKPGALDTAAANRRTVDRLLGPVDPDAPKAYLYKIAKRLGIKGRETMTKKQLVEAIQDKLAQAQRESQTASARRLANKFMAG